MAHCFHDHKPNLHQRIEPGGCVEGLKEEKSEAEELALNEGEPCGQDSV